MSIGLIGGTNADFGFGWSGEDDVSTPYGEVAVARGRVLASGAEVRFVRRHGPRHEYLSSSVNHRANVWALRESGCTCIVGTTVCGVIDPQLPLASLIVFGDLYFPDNRLPDGSPCTLFAEPGQADRGHYIFGSPFSPAARRSLVAAATEADLPVREGGTYAYALGPRFNTAAEIRAFAAAGACAVSQTAGPEAVLAGELELPYALLGFGVDYANGVMAEPTPVEVLNANIGASKRAFELAIAGASGTLSGVTFDTGFVYRFE